MKTSISTIHPSRFAIHAALLKLTVCLTLITALLPISAPRSVFASGGAAAEAEEEAKMKKEADELAEKLRAQLEKKDESITEARSLEIKQAAQDSDKLQNTIRHPDSDHARLPNPELIGKMGNNPIDSARLAEWRGKPANQEAMAERINAERQMSTNPNEFASFKASRAALERTQGAGLAQKAIEENLRVATVNANSGTNQPLPNEAEREALGDIAYGSPSFRDGFEGNAAATKQKNDLPTRQKFGSLDPALQSACTTFWGRLDAARRRPGGNTIAEFAGVPPTSNEQLWNRVLQLDGAAKNAAINADGNSPAVRDDQFNAARESQIKEAKSIYDAYKTN